MEKLRKVRASMIRKLNECESEVRMMKTRHTLSLPKLNEVDQRETPLRLESCSAESEEENIFSSPIPKLQ